MNDDHIENTRTPVGRILAGLNRRILPTGVATAGHLRLANAQTGTATPEAEVGEDASATPDASTSTDDDGTALATGVLDDVQAMAAAVQADRDAVADEIDATTGDEVLSQANSLLDDGCQGCPAWVGLDVAVATAGWTCQAAWSSCRTTASWSRCQPRISNRVAGGARLGGPDPFGAYTDFMNSAHS